MKIIKLFALTCCGIMTIVPLISSCTPSFKTEEWRHVELYPKDSSQVITVITTSRYRYIANGRHKNIPKQQYLKLDMAKVDALGDGISICWDKNGNGWKIASAYAELVENKLDTLRYRYAPSTGSLGEPRIGSYADANCGGTLIRERSNARGNVVVRTYQDKR